MAKYPHWLTEKQVAILEGGRRNLGRFACWWAVEDGETAAVEARSDVALANLNKTLTKQSFSVRWALGDFARYPGTAAGRRGQKCVTPVEVEGSNATRQITITFR